MIFSLDKTGGTAYTILGMKNIPITKRISEAMNGKSSNSGSAKRETVTG